MSRTITYSPAYTLVVTHECFNRCAYCNFRVAPGQDSWLSIPKAWQILQSLQGKNVCEILILSGEIHPQSPKRQSWLQRIHKLCQLALSLGFLPHTNVGPLSFTEMKTLKSVNVSMGLMLEQITPKLLETVHRHAPSKVPQLRLKHLEWAGQLKVPFTTGLLLGIGENSDDWWETLGAITRIHQKWGHIQEVILQPHSLGRQQTFLTSSFNPSQLPEIIAKARQILPNTITLQIPPNLILDPSFLLDCLEAGAKDLGGISLKDEINPNYPHLIHKELVALLHSQKWNLVPRLPIYPQYDSWLPLPLKQAVKSHRTQQNRIN
ncbi:MAG: 7,8-didemethyl-8-hydroxy-5-deazariboflavin synthase subunit CofG [cyanobacterium endosymbiont of Rhopalodia yunnanensis]